MPSEDRCASVGLGDDVLHDEQLQVSRQLEALMQQQPLLDLELHRIANESMQRWRPSSPRRQLASSPQTLQTILHRRAVSKELVHCELVAEEVKATGEGCDKRRKCKWYPYCRSLGSRATS